MIPHKAEGPPPSEGPSEKSVRESGDSVVHPPSPTGPKYIPGGDGVKERWAMVPSAASGLPVAQLRVLVVYSRFANRWRISFVSENRVAAELGWYYGKDKTPNRRNVARARRGLEDLGYIVDAGIRRIPGSTREWVRAYLVAPYQSDQRVDLEIRKVLTPESTMRQFWRDDASVSNVTMRQLGTHIQRFTDLGTENGNGASSSASRLAPQEQERIEEEQRESNGNGQDLTGFWWRGKWLPYGRHPAGER